MFNITFRITDTDVYDHAADLEASFNFEDAPEWSRLTQKFQDFLTGYGYRFRGHIGVIEDTNEQGREVQTET